MPELVETKSRVSDFENQPEFPSERARKLGRKPTAIVLIPGSWHRKEHMLDQRQAFSDADYRAVVVDFGGQIRGNAKLHAKQVAGAMKDAGITRAILFGASYGADIANWVPAVDRSLQVDGFVYGAGALLDETLGGVPEELLQKYSGIKRNTDLFMSGIERYWGNISKAFGAAEGELGLTWYSKEAAPKVFFNRCDPLKAQTLTHQLRAQWRGHEPKLNQLHPAPKAYLYGDSDNVITEEWARSRSDLVGAEYIPLTNADHTLTVSATDQVTKAVDAFAREFVKP